MGKGIVGFVDALFGMAESANKNMERVAKQKAKDPNLSEAQRQHCRNVAEESKQKSNDIKNYRKYELEDTYGALFNSKNNNDE